MKKLITVNNLDYEHIETFNTYEEMYNTLVVNCGYDDYISWLDDYDSSEQDKLLYYQVDNDVYHLVAEYEAMRKYKSFNEDLYKQAVFNVVYAINDGVNISWWKLMIEED